MNIRKYSLDFILNGDFENNNFYICCLVKYFYLRLCKCVYIYAYTYFLDDKIWNLFEIMIVIKI